MRDIIGSVKIGIILLLLIATIGIAAAEYPTPIDVMEDINKVDGTLNCELKSEEISGFTVYYCDCKAVINTYTVASDNENNLKVGIIYYS